MNAIEAVNAAPEQRSPWVLREGRAGDVGFVTDSWRESFYSGAPAVQFSDREHYNAEMSRLFTRLKDATVIVCCDATDDDALLGFAVHTRGELHYVYVRKDFRKMGIARALCERIMPRAYTFATVAGIRRFQPRERGWKFTPRFTL